MSHNPERASWKGRSYRKGGERVRDLRERSADSLALDILLADLPEVERQRQLGALSARVREAHGFVCPECGSEDTEDNGCSGSSAEYRCGTCHHHWGPGTET